MLYICVSKVSFVTLVLLCSYLGIFIDVYGLLFVHCSLLPVAVFVVVRYSDSQLLLHAYSHTFWLAHLPMGLLGSSIQLKYT